MKLLVVGATGYIGSALLHLAHGRGIAVEGTSRRREGIGFAHYDLLAPQSGELPACDVAFLCAGVADYRRCEGNAEAYRINVDGNMAAGKRLMVERGAFVVYLSSVAAEWAGHSAYGRHKILVETFLQAIGEPAIVRFERVTPQTLTSTCERLLQIGMEQRAGIHHL